MYADCFHLLGGFSVFAGVGERTREGNDLYREMIESGVIKLGDKQVNPMLVIMNTIILLAICSFTKVVNYGYFIFRAKANVPLCTVK
jgi:hypothetical protein